MSNYQVNYNFGHLANNGRVNVTNNNTNYNFDTQLLTLVIKKPLIVVLGISIYDQHIFHSLECVPIDYKNIEHAFNIIRGYDFLFYNQKNEIKLKHHNINQKQVSGTKQFKLKWDEKEIFEFNDKIEKILNTSQNNYDGLLYFISCHGDTGVIYDSNGNKVPLITIFDKFNNQNCVKLRNKPKIYFVEACRGSMRTQRYNNSNIDNLNARINITQTKLNKNLSNSKHNQQNTIEQMDEKKSEMKEMSEKSGIYSQKSQSFSNKVIYSKYNYNREIYANTEGYAVVEPGSKGAYLIRSITQAIVNNQTFKKDFDQIMIHSRKLMLEMMGMSVDCGAQVIDDHNKIPKKIVFKAQ